MSPARRLRLFADTTPLRTPDFRRLWVAGIVTVIGANLTIFAVPVQLYALTQNSAYVGLAGVFALVPLIVFGLLGGAWADAMDRRLLLIITSCGLGVASVLLWLQAALGLNNLWVVLVLLGVQQSFFAINSPTLSASIPRMLPIEQLPAANSLNMTVQQFGAIVGPLLAGLMLHWIDLSTPSPAWCRSWPRCGSPRCRPPSRRRSRGCRAGGWARSSRASGTWPATRWC
jgi:MFS family permease